jgi:hypothetical protein
VLRCHDRPVNMVRPPSEAIFESGAEHQLLRDIMSDVPGRSLASIGGRL